MSINIMFLFETPLDVLNNVTRANCASPLSRACTGHHEL